MDAFDKLVQRAKERPLKDWALDAAVLGSLALNATLIKELYDKIKEQRKESEE